MAESFPVTELTWELETIFPGGISSALFDGEVRHVLELLEELGVRLDELPALSRGLDDAEKSRWRAFLFEYFEVYDRLGEVRAFASAHGAASGGLGDAGRVFGRVEEALAARSQLEVRVQRFFRGIEERVFEEFIETSDLEELRPWLSGIREEADASMEPELEELASALSRDGLHPWQILYRRIAGDLIVRTEVNGEVEELSLGQAGTIWKHPDAAKRHAVFEGLQHAWGSVAPICALALNAKVGMEQTLYKRRGEGCLTRSLRFNRIEQSTVDTMMSVASEFRPLMVRYMRAKAQAMGKGQLSWCDFHAPLGESRAEAIPYPEAQRFLIDHLEDVHPAMAQFCRFAFTSRWVEVEDRPGKAPGAFCVSFMRSRQVRVFMTYGRDGLGDLAHELGHGYHSWKMKDQHSARTFVPMTLAETASILAERIVEQALIDGAKPQEELALLDRNLGQALGNLVNLPARYALEKAMHRERERGLLDERCLSDLTEEIFSEAYGGGVAQVDRLYWASTASFFDTRYPFYNYPYTFGYFFSHAIHAMAQEAGAGFSQRIDEILENSGGVMTCEEVGKRFLGVDLSAPQFWRHAAGPLEKNLQRFEALVQGNQY